MEGSDALLQIRLLGGLQLTRHGRDVKLPASKKTRALLGYLVATGQPHRRERLCDLLWDGPDDPRAELRWSLSKLRPLLTLEAGSMLLSDQGQVGFTPAHAEVDLLTVQSLLTAGIAATPTARLHAAADLYRGELLDGLDLPLCYRYQEWCTTAREAAGRQHRAILSELVERLDDQPEDALRYARALVAADPLAEAGHAAVVRLLGRLDRKREAQAHYARAQQVLATELGVSPGDELTGAYQRLRSVAARPALPERPRVPGASFVGRREERAAIDQIAATLIARQASPVVLVTGEPGIGKSHLLAYLATRLPEAGGHAVGARAYEAEVARSYGVWIDVLRAITRGRNDAEPPSGLGLLLPELGAINAITDQARLLDAVVETLRPRPGAPPLALLFDDIQWLDEASCTLLHYLARQLTPGSGLLLACAARAGELDDNAAAAGVLRSLRRDGRLREIELVPLSEAETRTLIRSVDATIDTGRIYSESDGNPLFALELARAHQPGGREGTRTIDRIIAEQLGNLHEGGRNLLVWASALGRGFHLEDLIRISTSDPAALLVSLDELERHGLIRPTGADAYEFRHELIRQSVYRSVSQPRRAVIHRQIARALLAASDAEPALASDAAHHAALGNDHDTAAHACILAGQHALKLFATAAARGFALRGARHLTHVPPSPTKVERRMALLEIQMLAGTGPNLDALPQLANEILDAVAAAEALGLHAATATGHYLLSVLYQDAGDRPRAEQSTLRAAQAGRTTDRSTQAHQLANTARCLLELETQVGRARGLVAEAEAIVVVHNLELCELHWAVGLLRRWDGVPDAAVPALERALSLARYREDRRREYKCLTWLAMLAFEQEQPATVAARCTELTVVAERLGHGALPFVATLLALSAPVSEQSAAALGETLQQLRVDDDKSYLAYALNAAAQRAWEAGDAAGAADRAREALAAATIMRRQNATAIARSLLARLGDDESVQAVRTLLERYADPDTFSAHARAALLAAAPADHPIPTPVPMIIEQA